MTIIQNKGIGTAMYMTCSATGEKLKPTFAGNSPNRRCFKNIDISEQKFVS